MAAAEDLGELPHAGHPAAPLHLRPQAQQPPPAVGRTTGGSGWSPFQLTNHHHQCLIVKIEGAQNHLKLQSSVNSAQNGQNVPFVIFLLLYTYGMLITET